MIKYFKRLCRKVHFSRREYISRLNEQIEALKRENMHIDQQYAAVKHSRDWFENAFIASEEKLKQRQLIAGSYSNEYVLSLEAAHASLIAKVAKLEQDDATRQAIIKMNVRTIDGLNLEIINLKESIDLLKKPFKAMGIDGNEDLMHEVETRISESTKCGGPHTVGAAYISKVVDVSRAYMQPIEVGLTEEGERKARELTGVDSNGDKLTGQAKADVDKALSLFNEGLKKMSVNGQMALVPTPYKIPRVGDTVILVSGISERAVGIVMQSNLDYTIDVVMFSPQLPTNSVSTTYLKFINHRSLKDSLTSTVWHHPDEGSMPV